MKQYLRLSYDIKENTPLYPKTNPIVVRKIKDRDKGDSCNTYYIKLSNHTGTHIDAPRHFFSSGRAINDYSLEELVFHKPLLVDCPQEATAIIGIEDLRPLIQTDDFDMLLIRTGFFKYRNRPEEYCYRNPCISPETARWLRNMYPKMKVIGIDCISIASYIHRDLGNKTHKIFLKDGLKRTPVLILEDMHIPDRIKRIDEIIISPIFMEAIDSAPCTVIGILHD